MATECSREAVLQFLTENGGKVKNVELVDEFKALFPSDPAKKALVRDAFKGYVDSVAFVKVENGVKFVYLKKKYRSLVKQHKGDGELNGNSVCASSTRQGGPIAINGMPHVSQENTVLANIVSLNQNIQDVADSPNGLDQKHHVALVSASPDLCSSTLLEKTCSFNNNSGEKPLSQPEIVEEAPPLVEISDIDVNLNSFDSVEADNTKAHIPTWNGEKHCSPSGDNLPAKGKGEESDAVLGKIVASRRRVSRGSQRSLLPSNPSEDGVDEGHADPVPTSESNTPKSSRKNFLELMMSSSPQVRRSIVHRNVGHSSVRHRDRESGKSDSDSGSVVSSIEEDGGPVMLDPLEHEWMMCASGGQWESLHRLLMCDPSLLAKKDFVTGFTCLHWAAKQGKQELIALLVSFAKQHEVPHNINARSSAGYTPLHLAAMHNHLEVVKLLVGAYDADINARDYSGRKAAHYLPVSVHEDIRDIIGATVDFDTEVSDSGSGRWRLSRVLSANLMPLKMLNQQEEEAEDGTAKSKSMYRKSSIHRMKPRLQKIKLRTQIVHSTSFRESEERENLASSPAKSRPKSNLFG